MFGGKVMYAVIHKIYDGPIFNGAGDLVQLLVHFHTSGFCVVAEAETDYAVFLAELDRVTLV